MVKKLILGIDPGSRYTGYALLEHNQDSYTVPTCDVIYAANIEEHSDRLNHIFKEVSALIRTHRPDTCAIETPVYGVDPLAMLKLGRAQAAAMLAITTNRLPVTEYYPKKIKKSITGNGNASKKQVAFMLRKMVDLPDKSIKDDATDALAVAWCHSMTQNSLGGQVTQPDSKKHQNRKSSSWSEFVKDNPDRVKD